MSNFPKELRFSLKAPLNNGDTENTTFGCRHTNPDICNACYLENVCAFCSKDKICKKPSAKWKKTFEILKEETDELL